MCIDSDRFGHQRYYETYQDLLVHMQDLFHVARSRFPLSVPGMNGKSTTHLGYKGERNVLMFPRHRTKAISSSLLSLFCVFWVLFFIDASDAQTSSSLYFASCHGSLAIMYRTNTQWLFH